MKTVHKNIQNKKNNFRNKNIKKYGNFPVRKDIIVDLSNVSIKYDKSVSVVGGKGKAIIKLQKINVLVPNGIILTTKAFGDYLLLNKLDNPNFYAKKYNKKTYAYLQNKLRNARLPDYFYDMVYSSLKRKGMHDKSLAVRSSATVEDSNNVSFAGLFKTFINVNSIADVLASIKEVYNSMFAEKALAYLHDYPQKNQDIGMAIILQEVIFGEVSGVAFTKDPLNNSVFLIESVIGLNEILVSGKVSPSRFEIDPQTKKLLRKKIEKQPIVQVPKGNKGIGYAPNKKSINKLFTKAHLADIVGIGLNIESLFKQPQDIEWTINKNKVYILQSRPITTKSKLSLFKIRFEDKSLKIGYPVSGGIVKGNSAIVKTLNDKIKPGSILIFKFTDTECIPLMRNAKGLIVEEGGVLSHAAIVSRELGIPCIVGARNARKIIGQGNNIILDASSGTVYFAGRNKRPNNNTHSTNINFQEGVDLASFYCPDTVKRAVFNSKIFYYEIFENSLFYYTNEGITKAEVEKYIRKKKINITNVTEGGKMKSNLLSMFIEGAPFYFKDKNLKTSYLNAIATAQKFDAAKLDNLMDSIKLFADSELHKVKEKECTNYADCAIQFSHYWKAQLAYLLINTLLCEGYCIRTIYYKVKPILKKYNISFSDLLRSFGNDATILPLNIGDLKQAELDLVNEAADYYMVAKRWKEESYPIFLKLGATGQDFDVKIKEISEKCNLFSKRKKNYRELFADAINLSNGRNTY